MPKPAKKQDVDLQDEYDFSGGVRGKYAKRAAAEKSDVPQSKSHSTATSKNRRQSRGIQLAEILTLAETAAYLRLGEDDVVRLVEEQSLPGRRVGNEWRFLKEAVRDWLRAATPMQKESFWQTHFGALKDDPYLQAYIADSDRRHAAREGR